LRNLPDSRPSKVTKDGAPGFIADASEIKGRATRHQNEWDDSNIVAKRVLRFSIKTGNPTLS